MIAITPEECEFYTPQHILERVYQVMHIDLDPCSPKIPVVNCSRFYTKETDGLSQKWGGDVYMNPPYGKELKKWIHKLCEEYSIGNVTNAIVLVPHKTDTKWFREIASKFYCACAIYGRLKYDNNYNKEKNVGTFASMIALLSNDKDIRDKFYTSFKDIGMMYLPNWKGGDY